MSDAYFINNQPATADEAAQFAMSIIADLQHLGDELAATVMALTDDPEKSKTAWLWAGKRNLQSESPTDLIGMAEALKEKWSA